METANRLISMGLFTRSTYWDEYFPPREATLEVEKILNEKFKDMFPETFEKYS